MLCVEWKSISAMWASFFRGGAEMLCGLLWQIPTQFSSCASPPKRFIVEHKSFWLFIFLLSTFSCFERRGLLGFIVFFLSHSVKRVKGINNENKKFNFHHSTVSHSCWFRCSCINSARWLFCYQRESSEREALYHVGVSNKADRGEGGSDERGTNEEINQAASCSTTIFLLEPEYLNHSLLLPWKPSH